MSFAWRLVKEWGYQRNSTEGWLVTKLGDETPEIGHEQKEIPRFRELTLAEKSPDLAICVSSSSCSSRPR